MGVGERIGDRVCMFVKGCGLKERARVLNGYILFPIDDTEVIPTCLICYSNSWDEEMQRLKKMSLFIHVEPFLIFY